MADLKISQLTGATTPLAGTEVVPVVQSSTTKKVAVSDLTAGRAVSGASFNVTGSSAPTNGTYLFSANTVSIATNSTERFRVGSTGDLTSVGTGSGTAHTFYNTGSNSGARTMFSFNYITAAFSGYAAIRGVTETTYDDSLSLEFYTGGGTKRVTMAAGGDVTLNTGNLVQGTAAKGVNFTANTPAAGMTSQLLNWYEEGTFTATLTATTPPTTPPTATARYTRVGRLVTVHIDLSNVDTSGASGDYSITGLPFTSANNGVATIGALNSYNFSSDMGCGFLQPNSTTILIVSPYAASITTTAAGAGKYVRVTMSYIV